VPLRVPHSILAARAVPDDHKFLEFDETKLAYGEDKCPQLMTPLLGWTAQLWALDRPTWQQYSVFK
jgi:hypothetical protein